MIARENGAASRPRFGIIGTGEIVRMVRPALLANGSLQVVALAGRNPAATAALAAEFGSVTACRDYHELLKRDLDAVFIATPPHLHLEMVEAALAAGKHVVCEKPLVMNLDELARMETVQRRQPHLKVASCSSRFNVCPPVRRAREMIAAGQLGRILTVRLNSSIELPKALSALPAWKRHRSTSGGGLAMDWGVYDLDWLQFVLGDLFQPLSVMGSVDFFPGQGTGLETSYLAHLHCGGGLTIALERRPEHGPRFQRAEIRGTEGGLDLPFMPGDNPHNLLWHRRTSHDELQTEVLPEQVSGWDAILSYPIVDLAHALSANREVASPLAAQAPIYRVIAALYQSASSGASVPVLAGATAP